MPNIIIKKGWRGGEWVRGWDFCGRNIIVNIPFSTIAKIVTARRVTSATAIAGTRFCLKQSAFQDAVKSFFIGVETLHANSLRNDWLR